MFFLPSLKKSGKLDRVHITVCIVGSRKIEKQDDYASRNWDIFAPNLTIYGFDADVEACEQANADLEARKVNWTENHIPLALSNKEGKSTLYVNKYPGCSSLYPPNESYMQRFNGYIGLILDRTIEIETTTLDTFCHWENIKEIDFIHLDVQGGELSVLEGASEILKQSILAVYSEVEFTDIYVNQPLFGDLDVYLRNQSFTLFDLIVSTGRAVRTTSPITSRNRPGSLVWADAFYLRDLMRPNLNTHLQTPERILKLACIADVMDYTDYALELLEYLTLNYGTDPHYNFADNIIESLAQNPELVKYGLENLPIVNRLRDYISSNNIYLASAKTQIKGNTNRKPRGSANLVNKSEIATSSKPSVCKFLKFRDEIYKCTDYLHRNGYASHNLVCKDWDIAHIIFDLSDGNLLDMGSSDSYILKNAVLKNVQGEKYGIDLQPPDVPLEEVKYMIGDLMDTKLPDHYFTNITCLSVIEHEVDFKKFATEVSRLLIENGKLYVTFDYWTPKLKPDFKLYDRLWNPLDENDTKNLIDKCKNCGLNLVEPVDWSLGDAVIKPGYFSPGANISYTFGMLVFQKN
ncbi:FkbM family methyltransferase [Microcoleus sp. Pol11C1]|uniref:FkbM family methyltransferase n=1 Tax=unclassified Microcoleus TaxID=2642155 RepID=UPI002FD585E8